MYQTKPHFLVFFVYSLLLGLAVLVNHGIAHGSETVARKAGIVNHSIAKTAASGADIYNQNCSVCHGEKGNGKSRARGLTPPPTDFTATATVAILTRQRMLTSVAKGRPKTAMSAWQKRLPPEEIEAVVDYIRTAFMPSLATADASTGRTIFAQYCSVCHGDAGNGAVWAKNGLNPTPRDFTHAKAKQELTRKRMIFSVTYGRPETAMSSWGKRLSKAEIDAVVSYVRRGFMNIEDENVDANNPAKSHAGHNATPNHHTDHATIAPASAHADHNEHAHAEHQSSPSHHADQTTSTPPPTHTNHNKHAQASTNQHQPHQAEVKQPCSTALSILSILTTQSFIESAGYPL